MTRKRRRCGDCGGSFTGEHREVGLTDEYGSHAHVDSGIAPLVAACWAASIPTKASCQGSDEELAYLMLPTGFAEAFARAATLTDHPEDLEDEGELDWRLYAFSDAVTKGGWRWIPGYPCNPGFSVHFPAADIPELVHRLECYR
jgi:hypothetical protein